MASSSHEISTHVRRICSYVFCLVLVAGAGISGRARTPNGPHPDQTPQRDILLNGLRIAVAERPGDRVAVALAIRAGSMFDPTDRSGLANLTAGLLLRGAGSYTGDRIRSELEEAGATLSVRTDWDATWIEAEAPAPHLATILDVVSLMISAPRFAPEDVEAMKRAALDHVAAELKDPSATADRAFAKALYGPHTYGRSIWGDAESIQAISRGDVQVFYDKFYAANAAVLAIAGPAGMDVITELARPRFGRWTKRKIVPATFLPPLAASETRVYVVDRPGVSDTVVRAGFWTKGRASADAPSLEYLAESMCGAFRSHVRPDAVASFDPRVLQSPFVIGYDVPAAQLGDSITAVAATIANATPDAVASCTAASRTGSSDLSMLAHQLAAADFYGAQNLQTDAIGGGAPDATRLAAARATLKPSALTVVVVGDAKQISAALADRFKVEVLPAT